jgi:hypothetical protein
VVKSLLVESLVFAVSGIVECSNNAAITKIVTQASEYSNKLLFMYPTSLLAMNSAAEMAVVMRKLELNFNGKPKKIFDWLTSHLNTSNHFM